MKSALASLALLMALPAAASSSLCNFEPKAPGTGFGVELIGAEAIKSHLRRGLMVQLLARSPRATDTAPSGIAAAAIVDQVDALEGYFARYLPAAMQAALLPLIFGAMSLLLLGIARPRNPV